VKSLSRSVAMMVATAAVLPLVAYGLVSVRTLRAGTRQSVVAGNESLAARTAAQIEQYVAYSLKTLQAAGSEVRGTHLAQWQQERIVRNFVLSFPEFREITLYDDRGTPIASSRLSPPPLPPIPAEGAAGGPRLSPVDIDEDLLPRTTAILPIEGPGTRAAWLAGALRLEEMWRLVDALRVGERGYALLVDERGRLIAHGNPAARARVAQGDVLRDHPLVRAAAQGGTAARAREYVNPEGVEVLGVAAPLPSLAWTLLIEQPTREAYGLALGLERLLLAAIGLALLVTIGLGYRWGRSFLEPIAALMRGTEALAAGRLDTRVDIAREDEFRRLGEAFNGMADRLTVLQDETRRQARQAMFGRIAAGLVHDLAHPIQNIGNNCRLMLKMYDEAEYRETFRRTVERELQLVRRVLEDLRNLARPIPLERFPVDLGRLLAEVVESMRAMAGVAGLTFEYQPPGAPLVVEGDRFALGRVYRNLILNAMQATAPGGEVVVTATSDGGRARTVVRDTGCGIPAERMPAIFDDFETTKRRGLGLGLPIARKIVEQLGGTIAVRSEVGAGTEFAVEFPLLPRQAEDVERPTTAGAAPLI
jgi:signal transduction histidine kinase